MSIDFFAFSALFVVNSPRLHCKVFPHIPLPVRRKRINAKAPRVQKRKGSMPDGNEPGVYISSDLISTAKNTRSAKRIHVNRFFVLSAFFVVNSPRLHRRVFSYMPLPVRRRGLS
jgi:hypothetical protein